MANPIHRINIVDKDKRSQRKVADSTTELDKTTVHSRLAREHVLGARAVARARLVLHPAERALQPRARAGWAWAAGCLEPLGRRG